MLVSFDPRVEKSKGFVTRRVTITSNDPAAPVVGFTITANIKEK